MGGKLTLANLSKLPEDAVAVMKTIRTDGSILDTDPNEQWTEGSLPRGCVAALVGVGRKILSERLILSTAKDAESLRPYALVAAILVDRMNKARSRRLGIKALPGIELPSGAPGSGAHLRDFGHAKAAPPCLCRPVPLHLRAFRALRHRSLG